MALIVVFIIGLVLGYLFTKRSYVNSCIGTLRVDHSDPDDDPYLFVEFEKNPDVLNHNDYVVLKVNFQDYISRN